ncbi:MAG TPA: hypothetical protein VGC99_25105 [Candidatus Tectomicrobia bacterium]
MAPANDTTLGRELLHALEAVNGLILRPASPQDREHLSQTRARLIEQIGALVDTNLDRANQDYQRATSGLQAASGSIRRAMSGADYGRASDLRYHCQPSQDRAECRQWPSCNGSVSGNVFGGEEGSAPS